MICNNCSSKFCITCINELVDYIEGFDAIPPTVKRCDATYRKIIQIQKEITLACRTTEFGPCCLFRVIDTTSTLVKTPRPDPTVRCSRIQSIKNYRQCIGNINTKKNKLQSNVNHDKNVLEIEQYFRNPIHTSHLGAFHKKETPKWLHKWIAYKQRRRLGTHINSTHNPFSSGKTCLQSDQYLLDCIHDVPGLCCIQQNAFILHGLLSSRHAQRHLQGWC